MIILFHGEDSYRSKKALADLKNKFIKDVDPEANNLFTLSGEKIDVKNFEETVKNTSLFSFKRLIIIECLFKNKKTSIFDPILEIIKTQENKTEDTIIFYEDEKTQDKKLTNKQGKKLFNFLKEQKFSKEFKKLSQQGKLVFIQKELNGYNKKITNSAANFLLNSFSNDNWALMNELKKISFSIDKEIITLEDVKKVSKEIFYEDIFTLTDAVSQKDTKKSLELLEKQKLAGLSNDFLLTMLVRHFKILLYVKESFLKGKDQGTIASNLKLHPFVVKKSLAQINKFDFNELKDILNKLIEIDYKNKSGKANLSHALFSFVTSI
ncbi:MAG: DNA polymerase III subunit delta [Patescibacteria group bacterium]|jgi:DNA polymerase-3 subunit delta|nr:DNA polymerase III subunit delta [Patescibacteria group bacterium]